MELKSHQESFKKVLNQSYAKKLRKREGPGNQSHNTNNFQRTDVGYDLLKHSVESQLDNYEAFEVEAKTQLCFAREQIKEYVTYLKLQCQLLSHFFSNGDMVSTITEDEGIETKNGVYGEDFQEVNREDERGEKDEGKIDENREQNDEKLPNEFNMGNKENSEGKEDGYIFLRFDRDDSYVLI
jgi:hypothetical protein